MNFSYLRSLACPLAGASFLALFSAVCFAQLSSPAVKTSDSVQSGQPKDKHSTAQDGYQWNADTEGVSLLSGQTTVLRYQFMSGNKPIIYPIAGPHGVTMTRDFPMKPAEKNQTKDHIHHRSLWMTHGDVNGIDFWAETEKSGRVEHAEVVSSGVSDEGAKLVTTAKWVTPSNEVLLHESRTMIVSGGPSLRMIEIAIDLTAQDKAVLFGDTKEGSFAVRVPDTMAVDRKQGGVIVNEHGDRDGDAWGKRARWVDYSGPVDETTAGITILEHPDSYGHPCRWHVRSYGLFAANPFGEHHFTGQGAAKEHKLAPGETMHLHYKMLIHEGNADTEMIQDQWKKFASATDKSE
jgi:hypothetical protein